MIRTLALCIVLVDLGVAQTPNPGDVLGLGMAGGTAWIPLTNFVRTWSGTTGGIALTGVGVGTTAYFSPNNTASNLITIDAAGVTRCPITRQTILQNLYVVMSPAPGVGRTNVVMVMTNGMPSAIVVNVIGVATNGNDTIHFAIVPAGTEIGIKVVVAAASTSDKVAWSFEGR